MLLILLQGRVISIANRAGLLVLPLVKLDLFLIVKRLPKDVLETPNHKQNKARNYGHYPEVGKLVAYFILQLV